MQIDKGWIHISREKANGKHRFILNLKELNTFIDAPHFKIEDYRSALRLVSKNSFLASIDLKDAYYPIPIYKSHRKYLRFSFNNKLYQFNCLPFGLNIAPYIFTKLLKPVLRTRREENILLIAYLDDFLLIDSSELKCQKIVNKTITLLSNLGFLINWKKRVTKPTNELIFLGYTFNTVTMLRFSYSFQFKRKMLYSITFFL